MSTDPLSLTYETMPPIECTSWCLHPDGHPNEDIPAEQSCTGPEHYSPLSRVPSRLQSDGTYAPDYANVQAERNGASDATHLGVGPGDGRPVWAMLTPADAAALIASLQAALEEIGMPASSFNSSVTASQNGSVVILTHTAEANKS
jgi:hypothetical protein